MKNGIVQIVQQELEVFKKANFSRHAVTDGHVNDKVTSNVYETRTFVNVDSGFNPDPSAPARPDNGVLKFLDEKGDRPDNIVYLGMEVPKPLDDFYKALSSRISQFLIDRNFGEKQSRAIAKEFVDEANLSFILNVAHEQGLDRPIDDSPESQSWVKREYADRKFLSTFMVSQGSVATPVTLRSDERGNRLIIACGGDACATPHFMRYSGLSGGREHVDVIANLLSDVPFYKSDFSQNSLESVLKRANERYEHINEFVISRGRVFLPQSTPKQVAQNLFDEVTRLIDKVGVTKYYGSAQIAQAALESQLAEVTKFLEEQAHNDPEVRNLLFNTWEKLQTLSE